MTTADLVRPAPLRAPDELPGSRRVLPRPDATQMAWSLHLFTATRGKENAAVCLNELLRAELGSGGALSAGASTGGTCPPSTAGRPNVNEGFDGLVRAVTDPAHADDEHRVALVLSRHSTTTHRNDDTAHVRVLSPRELPRYEHLVNFVGALVRSPHSIHASYVLPVHPFLGTTHNKRTHPTGPRAWPRRMGREHDTPRIPRPRSAPGRHEPASHPSEPGRLRTH